MVRGSGEKSKMSWGREVSGMPEGRRSQVPHVEERTPTGLQGRKGGASPATRARTLQTEGKWPERKALALALPRMSQRGWRNGQRETQRDESGKDGHGHIVGDFSTNPKQEVSAAKEDLLMVGAVEGDWDCARGS